MNEGLTKTDAESGPSVTKKPGRVQLEGLVQKVIPPAHPSLPEKIEILVTGASSLYCELRITNDLRNDDGVIITLSEGAKVKVIIESI